MEVVGEDDEARVEGGTGVDDGLEFVEDDLGGRDARGDAPVFRVVGVPVDSGPDDRRET